MTGPPSACRWRSSRVAALRDELLRRSGALPNSCFEGGSCWSGAWRAGSARRMPAAALRRSPHLAPSRRSDPEDRPGRALGTAAAVATLTPRRIRTRRSGHRRERGTAREGERGTARGNRREKKGGEGNGRERPRWGYDKGPDRYRSGPLIKSGRPGSNWRPQPWQGCALPTELRPHCLRPALTDRREHHPTRSTTVVRTAMQSG